jgi:ABC-type multidrug transport system fused ATPase/permease subunit
MRDTPILILYEPTAGLDTASQQAVIGALDALMMGKTSVVIAHFPGTIRHADVVLMFKDSALVEHGTHEALLAQNGV